jgi:hypothetical protein
MGLTPQPPMSAAALPTTPQADTAPQPSVDPSNPPKEIQLRLWRLLMQLESDDEIPRREEIRAILQRRLFFRGSQDWWWDFDTFQWMPPNVAPSGCDLNDYEQPAFRHVTNIFQSTLLSLSAVLTQNNTNSKFFPKKASDPNAVMTAKKATKVTDFIHRNNDWQNMMDQLGYFLGTDGFIVSYSRYVTNGEQYGHDQMDMYAPTDVQVGPPTVSCPSCGNGSEGTTNEMPTCAECGDPMADIPAPTATIPQYAGTVQIPKGQEVISLFPALQVKRTMWADEQKDFMYLDLITDLHKSKAIAAYPDKEQALRTGSGDSDGGASNSYERIARRLLYLSTGRHTGMILSDLGTFRRAWIRKEAFYGIEGHSDNEQIPCLRCQMFQLYPDGAYVVFFNDVFCEARSECMDEKIESIHSMPGEGQIRETLMSAMVPVQQMLNDCVNLAFEVFVYGVPEAFADTDTIDFEARSNQVATAGNITPISLKPGQSADSAIKFTPAVEPSVAMMNFINMLLNEISQVISGNYPALAGGDTGSNDTLGGIALQRNQALGRLGRAWRRIQLFLANTDAKALKCFAKNRQDDVEIPTQKPSGDFDSDIIKLADMQGDVVAYPEVDAQYPTLQADVRGLITQLYTNDAANPISLQLFQDPDNLEYALTEMGASDIQVPGEQQRIKTYKMIDQLLQQQPQQVPAQPPSPHNPQGAPPQLIPSIKPAEYDDLKIIATTTNKWLISDEGLEAQTQNPAGFANVEAFWKAASQMEKAKELQQQVAAMAVSGEGPMADPMGAEKMQPPEGAPHPANLELQKKQAEAKANQPAPSGGGE